MPKMHTTAHFELDVPTATPEEMRKAEALMRDPGYQAEVLKAMNAIATQHARSAGLNHPINITGSIQEVKHA